MLSLLQVFLLSVLFFGTIGAFGIWAALSARRAAVREAEERDARGKNLLSPIDTRPNPGTVR